MLATFSACRALSIPQFSSIFLSLLYFIFLTCLWVLCHVAGLGEAIFFTHLARSYEIHTLGMIQYKPGDMDHMALGQMHVVKRGFDGIYKIPDEDIVEPILQMDP